MISKKEITIGSIVTISKGKKHSLVDEPSEQSKRLLAIDDLRNDNLIRFTNDKKGTEVQPDDVLIAWDGANAGTIGYGKSGFIGSTIARLRFKERDRCYAPFIGAFLRSKFDYLRQTATGATIPHINRKALEGIAFQEIDFDDQKRIAHLLGKVEGLIAQRKQHLQQLDDLLKSVFLEMFGFLDKTYNKWVIDPLSKHTEVVSGVTKGKKYKTDDLIDVPYMRVANVQDGHFVLDEIKTISVTQKEIEQYRLLAGDLLLTEGGDPDKLGRGAVWQNQIEKCIHQNHIFRVRVNDKSRINPDYLSALIGSPYGKSYFFRSAKQTTGIASINSTQLKKFPLVIPPIDLQNQFAAIVEKVESIKSRYQQSLTELETLYGALSQKAFKGELDLLRVPLPDEVEDQVQNIEDMDGEKQKERLFKLPEPNSDWLENDKNRNHQIKVWFDAYLAQLKSEDILSSIEFLNLVYEKVEEVYDEIEPKVSINDLDQVKELFFKPLDKVRDTLKSIEGYDLVKDMIFQSITCGRIMQRRNPIEIDGKPDLGNQIILKKSLI
ncbi:MAG: hypothetical protein HGA57_09110 [Chlorobium limicola]|uniref:restriction endonuclease subunit S n=1 Tax=Chlorobium limicola TaxID=1092 RepID=UPI0023F27905|nr:restriction endonuclease subunit S [Chlorobium limicola]NTV21524.1 hypothetical protein [Chlorobium limicola]